MPDVTIFEMSARDGLQNEPQIVATDDKVKLVDMLSDCGFQKIEVASFVSPKWVPQMADGAAVLDAIKRRSDVAYTALTPNMKGLEAAIAANAMEIAIFASASEGFSQKNINCSIAESLERFRPMMPVAKEHGLPVRGYVSCVTDCPYDGPTPPEAVAHVAAALSEMGCYEISLGDTIGEGTRATVGAMLRAVLDVLPPAALAGHFHDTKGRASENIHVSLDHGLRVFDSAVGGLGGCPFAPGSAGNVATEDVVTLIADVGLDTGIDGDALARAAAFARALRKVT